MAEESSSTFDGFLEAIGDIFEPLNILFDSSGSTDYGQVRSWFFRLGYDLALPDSTWDNFSAEFLGILSDIQSLPDAVEAVLQSNGVLPFPNVVPILEIVQSLISNLNNLSNDLQSLASLAENAAIGSQIADMARDLPLKILDDLMSTYLEKHHPPTFSLLTLLGIIEKTELAVLSIPPSSIPGSASTVQYSTVHWESIPQWITTPLSMMETVYQWKNGGEQDQFLANKFLNNLNGVIHACSLPGGVYTADINRRLKMGETMDSFTGDEWTEIRFPINTGGVWPDTYWEMGFSLSAASRINDGQPKGLAIMPYVFSKGKKDFQYKTPVFDISLSGGAEMDLSNGVGLILRPPSRIEYFNNLQSDMASSPPVKVEITLLLRQTNGIPFVLLGSENSTGISLNGVNGKIIFARTGSDNAFGFELSVDEIKLIIASGEGDGFLQKLLPQDPIRVTARITLGMSSDKGFYISGGAGMAYVFQINEQIGPVYVSTINMGLDITEQGMSLVSGISGSAQLGPVIASVDNIGLKANLKFGQPGLLGKADLDLAFKPPDGIGLAVESDAVQGGGKLVSEKPNYAGFVDLSVKDKFTLKAFGLLTTQMPDGGKGYSLVVEILTDFASVQLGFGFALTGVGGLIGINRMMSEDALRETINNHSLDCILFPDSPIKDSARILDAIRNIFPAKEKYYVFGLMVKIIWGGSIDLVKFMAGIIVELGGPGRVAILGMASTVLPDEIVPLLVLNLELLGFLDFGKKTLAVDSSLFDSRLMNYTLSGQMALRANWGDKPDFVLSIGGFHPRYPVPPGFPTLQRIGFSITNAISRIDLTSYFAIAPNTLQIGADLTLSADLEVASIDGAAGFNALFYFRPFRFETEVYAWIKVHALGTTLCGVSIDIVLSGPNPFHARGYASVEILWFTIDIPLDVTFGDPNPEALPPAHPLEDLKKELNDARNIRYELPAWAGESMVYAKGADKFLDPLGDIVFSQSVVPLNLELGMYGGGPPPADERKLDVGLCDAANYSIRTGAPPTSKFSPAQFIRVSDAEKLAAPAFEDFQSGIRFGPAYEFDPSAKDRKLEFEDILFESETYIRAHGTPQYQSALCRPLKFGAAFPGESNALRNAPLTGSQKYFTPARGIKRKGFVSVQNPAYAVSNGDSLGGKMCSDMAAGTTYTQAMAAHKRDGAEDGEVMDAGGLALKGG